MWGRKGSHHQLDSGRGSCSDSTPSSRRGPSGKSGSVSTVNVPESSRSNSERSRSRNEQLLYEDPAAPSRKHATTSERNRDKLDRQGGKRRLMADSPDDSGSNSNSFADAIPLSSRSSQSNKSTNSKAELRGSNAKLPKYRSVSSDDSSSESESPVERFTYELKDRVGRRHESRIPTSGSSSKTTSSKYRNDLPLQEVNLGMEDSIMAEAESMQEPAALANVADENENIQRSVTRGAKVDLMQLPDGTCALACYPDENLREYGSLTNAKIEKVPVRLAPAFEGVTIVDMGAVKPTTMVPGVQFYKSFQTEFVRIGRLKIAPRTVKPVETCERFNVILTALSGTVNLKSVNFLLSADGKPTLKGFQLSEGMEARIDRHSSYSIENWSNHEAVLMLCLVAD